jgi:leucyl/phenylalanyl-tRNA---protein transferase
VALVHLMARLKAGRFRLLDTQFVTDHLKTFGATEVSRRQYHKLLADALTGEADFGALALNRPIAGERALALALADPPAP